MNRPRTWHVKQVDGLSLADKLCVQMFSDSVENFLNFSRAFYSTRVDLSGFVESSLFDKLVVLVQEKVGQKRWSGSVCVLETIQ